MNNLTELPFNEEVPLAELPCSTNDLMLAINCICYLSQKKEKSLAQILNTLSITPTIKESLMTVCSILYHEDREYIKPTFSKVKELKEWLSKTLENNFPFSVNNKKCPF